MLLNISFGHSEQSKFKSNFTFSFIYLQLTILYWSQEKKKEEEEKDDDEEEDDKEEEE